MQRDYLDCSDDYLSCGDDYLDCGDDYLDCGDDVIPPIDQTPPLPGDSVVVPPPVSQPIPKGPFDQGPPRKDNWFAELFYKVIVFFNNLFSFRWLK